MSYVEWMEDNVLLYVVHCTYKYGLPDDQFTKTIILWLSLANVRKCTERKNIVKGWWCEKNESNCQSFL